MAGKSSGISAALKQKFLAEFAACGVICQAAERAGISDRMHYYWMKSPAYAKQFQAAEERAIQALEVELRRRATGYDEQVTYAGQVTGTVKRHSDLLLIFLLKSKRPDVYRDRYETKVSGQVDHRVQVTVVHELHESPGALPPSAATFTPQLPAAPGDETGE